jgi:hypothetical protein
LIILLDRNLILKILLAYLQRRYLRYTVFCCKNSKYYLVFYQGLIVQVKLRFLFSIYWKLLLVELLRNRNNSFYKKFGIFINLRKRMAKRWRPDCICNIVLAYALFSSIFHSVINLMDSPYMLNYSFCVVQVILIIILIYFSKYAIF